jgi:hypothetical protein
MADEMFRGPDHIAMRGMRDSSGIVGQPAAGRDAGGTSRLALR